MTKKLFCLILTACLLITMTACGGAAQEETETDVPKSEQTGTAGSSIPLKDNQEEAEEQIIAAMKEMLVESYEDKIDDFRISVEKIYSAEDEQELEILKDYNLGPDEVAFEVRYDLHPAEGVDPEGLLPANGEYDEESGWVINKYGRGVIRPDEDGSYTITDFGTGW